jgi:hypothetical protein
MQVREVDVLRNERHGSPQRLLETPSKLGEAKLRKGRCAA